MIETTEYHKCRTATNNSLAISAKRRGRYSASGRFACLLMTGLLSCVSGFVLAGNEPLWDLSKDTISPGLCSGKVEKVDGKVSLLDGAAFAVPAEAFPDQKNFTVQVTLSINELTGKAQFTFMNKQTAKDDGFDFSIMNIRETPGNYSIYSSVNLHAGLQTGACEWR